MDPRAFSFEYLAHTSVIKNRVTKEGQARHLATEESRIQLRERTYIIGSFLEKSECSVLTGRVSVSKPRV
jgi:hypothetical protein